MTTEAQQREDANQLLSVNLSVRGADTTAVAAAQAASASLGLPRGEKRKNQAEPQRALSKHGKRDRRDAFLHLKSGAVLALNTDIKRRPIQRATLVA